MYLIRWTKCASTMGVNISYTSGGYMSDIMENNENIPPSTKGCMYYRVLLFDIQFYGEKLNTGLKHKWTDHDVTNTTTSSVVENVMRYLIYKRWISLTLPLSLIKSVDSGMLVMELRESNIFLRMHIILVFLCFLPKQNETNGKDKLNDISRNHKMSPLSNDNWIPLFSVTHEWAGTTLIPAWISNHIHHKM